MIHNFYDYFLIFVITYVITQGKDEENLLHLQVFLKYIYINIMIKERLDLIVSHLGLSGRGFEKAVGLTNGSYSSLSDGMGADKLKKIFDAFPQFSADWLLTGRGEMFKNNSVSIEQNAKNEDRIDELIGIIKSQQKTIEIMASKGAAADAPGVASMAGAG